MNSSAEQEFKTKGPIAYFRKTGTDTTVSQPIIPDNGIQSKAKEAIHDANKKLGVESSEDKITLEEKIRIAEKNGQDLDTAL